MDFKVCFLGMAVDKRGTLGHVKRLMGNPGSLSPQAEGDGATCGWVSFHRLGLNLSPYHADSRYHFWEIRLPLLSSTFLPPSLAHPN